MSNINKWLFILLLLPVQLFSQQGPVLTLDSILKRIDRNNLLLQSYGSRAEAYKYSADAATAWMAPMAGVGTYMTPYPFQGNKLQDGADKGQFMIRAEQDIPNRSKLIAKKNYIQSQADVELANRSITLNNLKARAKLYYYNWLIAGKRINVLRKNEKLMQTMKKIEEVRYPYNQSQLGSIYKIDARIAENSNMITMQEGEISKSKAYLNSLMNQQGNESFSIDTTAVPGFTNSFIDTAALASARGDVNRMNQNIRSMQLNIESMKQERKPDFRIQYDNMLPYSSMMPKAYSVMGMISIPIVPWTSKMYKSGIKSMEYNIDAMEKERSAMLQETQGMVYGMQSDIEATEKQINVLEKNVIPSMEKSLDAFFINYQENKAQVSVVIDAWESLNMLQMNLLDQQLRLYQMMVDYEKEIYR
jgi:outer membrane protein, heavy metal efflux system